MPIISLEPHGVPTLHGRVFRAVGRGLVPGILLGICMAGAAQALVGAVFFYNTPILDFVFFAAGFGALFSLGAAFEDVIAGRSKWQQPLCLGLVGGLGGVALIALLVWLENARLGTLDRTTGAFFDAMIDPDYLPFVSSGALCTIGLDLPRVRRLSWGARLRWSLAFFLLHFFVWDQRAGWHNVSTAFLIQALVIFFLLPAVLAPLLLCLGDVIEQRVFGPPPGSGLPAP